MKNNRMCIAACVYGRKYQGWIPSYIYSIKKNYPEYDIKIFIDKTLSIGIKRILNKYGLYEQAELIENVLFEEQYGLKTEMEKRCFRWLVNDEKFENYEYVYWGDIDIYIVKEDISLLDQHIYDMKIKRLCYSNVIRLTFKDYIANRKECSPLHLFRLSGLHFVNRRQYFQRVRKTQKRIIRYLKGKRIKIIDHFFFQDDERCLWLIVLLSKMKLPNESYERCSRAFRPIHGIHFAIGREYNEYLKIFKERSIHFKDHEQYYKQFCEEYNNDETLRKLIIESPVYIYEIINQTCKIWKGKLQADEISM